MHLHSSIPVVKMHAKQFFFFSCKETSLQMPLSFEPKLILSKMSMSEIEA